jgi:hypothetical protein
MAPRKADHALCLVHVGELQLLFDPAEVRTIEGRYDPARVRDLPEVDLRQGLEQTPCDPGHSESLVVRGREGELRLIVCGVDQILRHELRDLSALPFVLRSYGRRLGLRGVVNVPQGVAYLAAPADLGAALGAGAAA